MTTIGLDLGSAKCGIVAAIDSRPVLAATIALDPANIDPTVAEILRSITESGADRLVIEWADRPYMPRDATPQQAAAMARNREIMVRTLDRVEQACKSLPVEIVRIAAPTWRGRIGVKKPADATTRAWVDGAVRAALLAILGPDAYALLADVHQRDAMGAVLGDAIGAPVRGKRIRKGRAKRARGEPGATPAPRAPSPYRLHKPRGSTVVARVLAALADGPMTQGALAAAVPSCGAILYSLVRAGTIVQPRPRAPYALPPL